MMRNKIEMLQEAFKWERGKRCFINRTEHEKPGVWQRRKWQLVKCELQPITDLSEPSRTEPELRIKAEPPLPPELDTLRLKLGVVWNAADLADEIISHIMEWKITKHWQWFLYLELKMDVNRGILWIAMDLLIDLCEIKIIPKLFRESCPFSSPRIGD